MSIIPIVEVIVILINGVVEVLWFHAIMHPKKQYYGLHSIGYCVNNIAWNLLFLVLTIGYGYCYVANFEEQSLK